MILSLKMSPNLFFIFNVKKRKEKKTKNKNDEKQNKKEKFSSYPLILSHGVFLVIFQIYSPIVISQNLVKEWWWK